MLYLFYYLLVCIHQNGLLSQIVILNYFIRKFNFKGLQLSLIFLVLFFNFIDFHFQNNYVKFYICRDQWPFLEQLLRFNYFWQFHLNKI